MGQLERYHGGLTAKYPARDVAIAYLTPFNSRRAGDDAPALPSVKEFRRFHEAFPQSVHISWLDLTEVGWNGGELWEQHRTYVQTQVASPQQLAKWQVGGRSRHLADFFGPEAAEIFDEHLRAAAGDLDGHTLDLALVQDPASFTSAFRVLIESRAVRGAKGKRDAFDDALRERFLSASTADVHEGIFALAAEHENAWVEGKADYGLRVAHPAHSSGVSLLTSRGVDRVEIGRPR